MRVLLQLAQGGLKADRSRDGLGVEHGQGGADVASHGTHVAKLVAHLREAEGHGPRDPRLTELVTALRGAGEPFLDLWERQDVRGKSRDAKTLHHPDVGALELTYQAFDVREAPGQQLVTYHAEPGSDSARALELLGALAASRRIPSTAAPSAGVNLAER